MHTSGLALAGVDRHRLVSGEMRCGLGGLRGDAPGWPGFAVGLWELGRGPGDPGGRVAGPGQAASGDAPRARLRRGVHAMGSSAGFMLLWTGLCATRTKQARQEAPRATTPLVCGGQI